MKARTAKQDVLTVVLIATWIDGRSHTGRSRLMGNSACYLCTPAFRKCVPKLDLEATFVKQVLDGEILHGMLTNWSAKHNLAAFKATVLYIYQRCKLLFSHLSIFIDFFSLFYVFIS